FVLTFDPRAVGCATCPATTVLMPSRIAADLFNTVNDRSVVVLVPMFLTVLWLRWRRASPAQRRGLGPFLAAAVILATVYLIGIFASADESLGFPYLLWELRAVLQIGLPIVFVAGLLSTRLAQSAVGHLVVDLQAPVPPGHLRGLLARTLAD